MVINYALLVKILLLSWSKLSVMSISPGPTNSSFKSQAMLLAGRPSREMHVALILVFASKKVFELVSISGDSGATKILYLY